MKAFAFGDGFVVVESSRERAIAQFRAKAEGVLPELKLTEMSEGCSERELPCVIVSVNSRLAQCSQLPREQSCRAALSVSSGLANL